MLENCFKTIFFWLLTQLKFYFMKSDERNLVVFIKFQLQIIQTLVSRKSSNFNSYGMNS